MGRVKPTLPRRFDIPACLARLTPAFCLQRPRRWPRFCKRVERKGEFGEERKKRRDFCTLERCKKTTTNHTHKVPLLNGAELGHQRGGAFPPRLPVARLNIWSSFSTPACYPATHRFGLQLAADSGAGKARKAAGCEDGEEPCKQNVPGLFISL